MKDNLQFHIKFLKEVEKRPCLYNSDDDHYNSKAANKAAWMEIGRIFGENGTACKSKWRSMRSSYHRWKSAKFTSEPGTGPKRDYYLAPYMQFVEPFVKVMSQDNTSFQNEDPIEFSDVQSGSEHLLTIDACDEQDVFEESFQESRLNLKREYRIESENSKDSAGSNCKNHKKDKSCKDSREMLLMSLLPHLKTMTDRQLLQFQMGVANLIVKIKYPDSENVCSNGLTTCAPKQN